MASNGQLPASALRPIPGNGQLRNDAARAYIALHLLASRKGVSMVITEGAIRRTYRPLSAQWLAWNTLPRGQAAYPGTSNHGWGLAVDLMSFAQRRMVDLYGAAFGWSKRWSDAAHEWWHLKFRPGVWIPPRWPRTIRKGSSGPTVERLQHLLRQRARDKNHPKDHPFWDVPAHGEPGHGYFGRTTRRAVVKFQEANKLTADGVVGPTTWRALGVRPT